MSLGSQSDKHDDLDRQARDAMTASAIMADVGVEHIAGIYAEAFLGAAQKAGRAQELIEEFDSLVADVLNAFPDFERVLASGLISHDDKSALLDRTLGTQASPILLNFLKVVARHGRLDILRPIHRAVHQQYERMLGRVRVQVTTATPLDEALAGRVTQSLRSVVEGEPLLERTVDPSILGGIVVRVGDTVYDGSIANQLKTLRQQMVDRSAHEIQSRRDRFRYPD